MALVDVYNVNKEKVGEVDLKEDIFGVEVKSYLLHEVVVWQRACRRKGTASTKTRGEVSGGGHKPWRQKGTGRARVGSNRSPLWRGGGTVFGPKPRSYAYSLPKKVRRAALKMALSSKLANGQLVVLEDYPFSAPKTKEFVQVMKKFDLEKALFITSEGHEALELSARNVPYVQVLPTAGLNVYDILRYDHLVLLSPAVAAIEARLTA
jgi:large subunit ribosomal protein L4|uniref:Large ribosomal subunit protein uL4 n=1 Tax=Desulfobacca acetoxidans TaxID=60893 RepID=A0A7V6A515_9BACT